MKKILTTFIVLITVATGAYLSSCNPKKEITKTACASSPTYTADIKPIMDLSCMPCHSSENHKHNIDLSSYEGTKAAAGAKSFMGSVKHEVGFDEMPMKKDKLNDATIEKLSCWVQNGMVK